LASAEAYADSLAAALIDVICLGIRANGLIAFNDPPVANVDGPVSVKLVECDQQCREQQVPDECLPRLELVPKMALTVTVPTLMAARKFFAVVSGRLKRETVRRTLYGPISMALPGGHPARSFRLHALSPRRVRS
jgi:glucosamine-6-phosphate deaminase